jgi:hypothetical protein
MAIKIFTRTKHTKVNNKYVAKMFGVIEGPIHQMMLKFPNEFKFVRHESTRALRPSKAQKKKDEQ